MAQDPVQHCRVISVYLSRNDTIECIGTCAGWRVWLRHAGSGGSLARRRWLRLVLRVGPDARCWMSRPWLCFRQLRASGGCSTYAGAMRSATVMPVTSTAGDAGSVERVVICGARWWWRRVRVSARGAVCAPWPRQQPALEAGGDWVTCATLWL